MTITDNRPIIEKESYDIIVVGGGISGIAAAVAAARYGMKVLLLEKQIILGGLATGGLISYYEPLCDSCGKQMTYGIAEELIKLSIQDGFDTLDADWKEKTENHRSPYATFYSPTAFSLVLDEYMQTNGVDIRFDSHAVFPVMDGKLCKGVVVESKGGKEFYSAKAVIDATGDAEIADKAGVPTEIGTNLLVGMAHYTERILAREYANGGKAHKFRKWLHTVNASEESQKCWTGVSSEDITEFVLKGHKAILSKIRQKENGEREVMMLPTMPQYRTLRRIVGKKVFCGIPNEKIEDCIGHCGDWRKVNCHYSLPYGSLYNPSFPNLWAVGRIISTDEKEGWEVARVIPVCALTGQAAGTAATICIRKGYEADTLPISALQERLRNDGVWIETK